MDQKRFDEIREGAKKRRAEREAKLTETFNRTDVSDLNLTKAEDRATFRARVSEEYVNMTFVALKREAHEVTGLETFANRHAAVRAIADARIARMSGKEMVFFESVDALMAATRKAK